VSSGPSIPQALVESLRSRLRAEDGGATLQHAIRTASEPDHERRVWALVELAGRLRREHKLELARLALNGALALDAGPAPTRAAYVCAVHLHADEGDLRTALKLGEELIADGQEPPLLRAMARVYWGLWKETKDESWHDRWWRVNVRLHEPALAAQ
jgi:hypothetical protein